MSDKEEIQEQISRWAEAVRNEDLDAIREARDPEILMFDVPPPLQARGLEAYMETWTKFFAWAVRPIAFELSDVQITAGRDVAFATAIGHCAGTESNGEQTQLEFRLTMGLRKRGGRWWVVHEHHSLPAAD